MMLGRNQRVFLPPLGESSYVVSNQLSTCNQCGQRATIQETYGLLNPDPKWPGTRVIEVVDCPLCGIHEQPDERMPRPGDAGGVTDVGLSQPAVH